MNLTFTFEAVELGQTMERMGQQLGIAGPKIVKVEAAALLKQVIRETSPDNRKQGKDAVRLDLYRAVTPLDPARFTNDKIAAAIRARDLPALSAIMRNSNGKWRNWEVVQFDPDSQHKAVRNARGRVPRFKRKFTPDMRFYKSYLKTEQARVGIAKSSWAVGYAEVGGSLPDWIAGHNQSGISTVISYLSDKDRPSITVISRAAGVVNDNELKRSIRRAMSIRTVAMERKTRRMLSDPLKYANLFAPIPMNTSTLALARLRCEAAVAAYIRNFYDVRATDDAFDKKILDVKCRREGTPLDQVDVIEAQSPINFTLPCVVVNAAKANPLVPGDSETGMTEVRVEIHVMTQLEEGSETDQFSNAAQRHANRLAQVIDILLGDVNLVMANLSSEEALIIDLNVFGMWLEDEDSQQVDLHWDDTLVFMFHCCAFNS